MDFGRNQDIFGPFFRSEKDSNYSDVDVKFKIFNKEDNKDFPLVQNLTMGEADFKQFMRLRNQLVIAAENFAREQKFGPIGDSYNVQRHE